MLKLSGEGLVQSLADEGDFVVRECVGEKCAEDGETFRRLARDELEVGSGAEFHADVLFLICLEDEIAGDKMQAAVMAFVKNDGSGLIEDEDFFRTKLFGEPVMDLIESAVQQSRDLRCWGDFYRRLEFAECGSRV